MNSMISSAEASEPGRRTTYAAGTSPASSSGRPITAASATAGWVSSRASSSAGATWKPLYLMSSLSRSTTNTWPSASTCPMSPVRSHPSSVIVSAVARSLLR